jgi:hypothetical protein
MEGGLLTSSRHPPAALESAQESALESAQDPGYFAAKRLECYNSRPRPGETAWKSLRPPCRMIPLKGGVSNRKSFR